jgi:hypothetical protein
MDREFSAPSKELPGCLSTISMVADDGAAMIDRLVRAERKSPPVYEPAIALFLRT